MYPLCQVCMCVNMMEMTADATAENQVESLLIGGSLSQMRAPSGQGTLRQPGGPPVEDLTGAGREGGRSALPCGRG